VVSGTKREALDDHFTTSISQLTASSQLTAPAGRPDGPGVRELLSLFDTALASRHLDLAARWLRSQGRGYYTIGSSGHESNAAVAAALRPTDPALLHYRSGGFFLARAQQVDGGLARGIRDVLLGLVAGTDEPISGGRHKVFGRADLNIIPQTSTIASHLPRAVGVAFSTGRARKLDVPCRWPDDAVTVCSFGDASVNHSTAVGALNTAMHTAYQGMPLPLLFVCEDNGIGISTRTPRGWVARTYARREGLQYFAADGSDLMNSLENARAAVEFVRTHRRPAFLHLTTVRLMGHAGSDYEPGYRRSEEIVADFDRDPVLCAAKTLVAHGVLSPPEVLDRYEATRRQVLDMAAEVIDAPQLDSAAAVERPLRETHEEAVAASAASPGSELSAAPVTVAQAINRALAHTLARHPEALVFGEDVARKGGVYGVTRGLQQKAGRARVFDTLLDEQAILGLALGAGVSGLLPIPEIQYLAYFHNAADQIRGEAATLQFFADRQYRNPMVVRVAGYGYQKGFGGHFHNDDSIAALRDIPGVVIASPARPDDAAAMMQACVAAAATAGAVCLYLEPIALYHTKDLHSDGDEQWLTPLTGEQAPIGRARTHGDGTDLTILTFGNGVWMSLRVARLLERHDISVRVVDLRWLAPLPVDDMIRDAQATGRVLIVDETRETGGVGEGVLATLLAHGYRGLVDRVASRDSFIPLGDAALQVLLSEDTIEAAAIKLARTDR
jgi:2-oxoisovalerate dehydrogenase E1 component